MNAKYDDLRLHAQDEGCSACKLILELIGPVHGPELPPSSRVNRWSMSPEEWAGQEPVDSPY